MLRLAEQEEGHCQSRQPQASPIPRRYLARDRLGKLGCSSLKPKKEEFQGPPPDLGVDTQIHPVSDLPNPAGSHPASSAVINHTHSHPRGRPPRLLTEETFLSQPHAKVFLSKTGVPQGSCARQRTIWFSGYICCEMYPAAGTRGLSGAALSRSGGP